MLVLYVVLVIFASGFDVLLAVPADVALLVLLLGGFEVREELEDEHGQEHGFGVDEHGGDDGQQFWLALQAGEALRVVCLNGHELQQDGLFDEVEISVDERRRDTYALLLLIEQEGAGHQQGLHEQH